MDRLKQMAVSGCVPKALYQGTTSVVPEPVHLFTHADFSPRAARVPLAKRFRLVRATEQAAG